MFPASGIAIPVAGILYEHYLYAPLIGIAFLAGLAGFYLYEKYGNRATRILLASTGVVILVFLIIQTISQNTYWKDPIMFYTRTLQYVPHDLRILNNLGLSYADVGNFKGAEEAYQSAILFNPTAPMPHHNLGNLYYRTGRLDEAIKEYRAAIALSPGSFLPYQALYRLYLDKNEPENAAQVMRELQSSYK